MSKDYKIHGYLKLKSFSQSYGRFGNFLKRMQNVLKKHSFYIHDSKEIVTTPIPTPVTIPVKIWHPWQHTISRNTCYNSCHDICLYGWNFANITPFVYVAFSFGGLVFNFNVCFSVIYFSSGENESLKPVSLFLYYSFVCLSCGLMYCFQRSMTLLSTQLSELHTLGQSLIMIFSQLT